jgi:hypothetical protein
MYRELLIPSRFNGPASSANGGYAAGSLAEVFLDGSPGVVQVTLRQPPPLDVAMLVAEDRTAAIVDGANVLEAKLVEDTIEPVEPVAFDAAAAAATRFAGFESHPFPTCFSCGPQRAEGDGLRIFPGMVDARRAATTWTPHSSLSGTDEVGTAVTWAALDCVSAWASDVGNRPMVLGRMACAIDARPQVGEPHVVMGRFLGADGRKNYVLATLYDSDGRIVARAGHIWIAVDPADFA